MLKVIEPGIHTTIQDTGRLGYQTYGVPVSGAMDLPALRSANRLVGNPSDEAALEFHSPIILRTDLPHLIAITGGEAHCEVGSHAVPMNMSVFARPGATIEIIPMGVGRWIYLAIHGGIDVPRVLGSKSTFMRGKLGGLGGRALVAGDEIAIGEGTTRELMAAAGRGAEMTSFDPHDPSPPVLRVILGPHNDLFVPEAINILAQTEYIITERADRMGYRLQGEALMRLCELELISCGVPLGALQVLPDGQPIVLMRDHQTVGGYPIIATMIYDDLSVFAQKSPGDRIRFGIVEPT
jgi:antagonist of KipI